MSAASNRIRRRRRSARRAQAQVYPLGDTYVVEVACQHGRTEKRMGVPYLEIPVVLAAELDALDPGCAERVTRRCNRCDRLRWLADLVPDGLDRVICERCSPRMRTYP